MEPAIASLSSLNPDGGIETPPLPPPGAHAATHLPLGGDPVSTDAPVTLTPSTNNEAGAANAFSNAAHAHKVNVAVHSGGYAGNASVGGAGTGFLQDTAVLRYPDGLAPVSPSTMKILATESGSDIVLTSSNDGTTERVSGLIDTTGPPPEYLPGDAAFRTHWPRNLDAGNAVQGGGGPMSISPYYHACEEWTITDNASALQHIARLVADFSPSHTGSSGVGLVFVQPTFTAGRNADKQVFLGHVLEHDLGVFTGMELGQFSSSFYQAGVRSFGTLSSGLQIGGSGSTQGALETGNQRGLLLSIRTRNAAVPMLQLQPRSPGTWASNFGDEPMVGYPLLSVDSYIVEAGPVNTVVPRFIVWGNQNNLAGRGTHLPDGDHAILTANKGVINIDAQGTPRYWRRQIAATGTGDRKLTFLPGGWLKVEDGTTGDLTLTYQDTGTVEP